METIKPSDDEKKDLLNQTNSNDTSISDSTISDAPLNNAIISDANEKDCSIFDTSINNSLEFSIPENIEVSNTINDIETYAPDISSIVTEENSFFEETKNNTVIDSENNVFIKKILPIISKVWVSGIVAMILYFVISYGILYKKVQTAVLLKDNIYKSENVGSPFVLGIIFPKIYIPFNMDEKEAFYVISHAVIFTHVDTTATANSLSLAAFNFDHNFWQTFSGVNGIITVAILVVAIALISQRALGCMALNRNDDVSLYCGTVMASGIMLVASSFMFNFYADFRIYATVWLILGLCGSVYQTCFRPYNLMEE
jgi:hypothetical protein